jgi:hypothetical protein
MSHFKTSNLVKTSNLINLARCFSAVADLPANLHVDLPANSQAILRAVFHGRL